MRIDNLNNATLEVTHHYLVCALWAEVDDSGEPLDSLYDLLDISLKTEQQALADCRRMVAYILDSKISLPASYTLAQLGHDLWLTRNGHGAGIWDRGLGVIGDELSDYILDNFAQVDLFITDDMQVAA
mgnify:CR=1 FL=1|jgi:hypothetical protein